MSAPAGDAAPLQWGAPPADYDDLAKVSPQATIFHRTWWLDAVAGSGNWSVATVRKKGVLVAAWPCVQRPGARGVLVGAPYTPYLGPIMREAPSSVKNRRRNVQQLEQLVEALGRYDHLEARCSPEFDYWTPLRWAGFTQTTLTTWRLTDLQNLDQALARCDNEVRRMLRKASEAGISVREGTIDEYLAVAAQAHGAAHATPLPPEDLMRRIDAAARANNSATVLIAHDASGEALAASYFLHDDRWTYYLLGASTAAARSTGAGTAVLWEMISRSGVAGRGFDFEGSVLKGVEWYFRSFGGEPFAYSVVRHTPSRKHRMLTAMKRTLRGVKNDS